MCVCVCMCRHHRGEPEQADPACSDPTWGQWDHHQHGSPGRPHHHRCKILTGWHWVTFLFIAERRVANGIHTLPPHLLAPPVSPPSAEERKWTGRSVWASRPISCPVGHHLWRTSWRCVLRASSLYFLMSYMIFFFMFCFKKERTSTWLPTSARGLLHSAVSKPMSNELIYLSRPTAIFVKHLFFISPLVISIFSQFSNGLPWWSGC